MEINPIYVMVSVVSLAVLIMVGINLYYMMRSRKDDKGDSAQYMVMHQRMDSFMDLMNKQLEQNRQSTHQATLSVSQQVQGFTQGITQIHEGLKQMHESVGKVASFQDILKAPKTRGMWGELSLEFSLSQYFSGSYKIQHYFNSGEVVDAVLKLPNELILPIDSKFSLENFQRMIKANNEIEKDSYRKDFIKDMKKRVDEIASKYILPSEGTTDFALMYIPAEAVYYEIINNLEGVDIPSYARSKKVGIVSPNTFYLTTASIAHWYKNVEFNSKTRDVMKRLEQVITDGKKLGDDFERLGKHISNTKSAFDDTEKRLSLMVKKVKNVVSVGGGEAQKELDAPDEA